MNNLELTELARRVANAGIIAQSEARNGKHKEARATLMDLLETLEKHLRTGGENQLSSMVGGECHTVLGGGNEND
jgi:hypothetical protein